MARYCGNKDSSSKTNAAQQWKEYCLLKRESLFSHQLIWTPENINALDQNFVKNLDEGEGDFFEKLEAQLAPTEPTAKQLAAEMMWLMLLCPSNIGPDKKRESIARIWSWSGHSLDLSSPLLTDQVLDGIGSAGTSYNTNRWRELVYFIELLKRLFKVPVAGRAELLSSGWALAEWLEGVPENNSRQLRHMLLYLLFPDDFERIFGGTDRRAVVSAFTGKGKSAVRKLSAMEIDRALADIRQRQVRDFETHQLDFYCSPLKEQWKEKTYAHWLFTWNPEVWPWGDIGNAIQTTSEGGTNVARWVCSNDNVSTGDRAWLIRLGVPPKGVMATGNIISRPYEALHYDEQKAGRGETCMYVDIEFTQVLDVFKDTFVTMEDLNRVSIDRQNWTPPFSGVEIKQRSAGLLEKLWGQLASTKTRPVTGIARASIKEPVNQIFYGPPGTGKTYELNRLKEWYRQKADCSQFDPFAKNGQVRYEFVTFHQAYSYEDFVEGIRPVQDERTGELVYRVVPGVFKRICQRAKKDPHNRYAIFIDEINRGNIAKILGELITLIETDKRASYDEDGYLLSGEGMELTLPYSGELFGVPKNLDIYGTMNTADRSIALLDTALRRRFTFKEMMPDSGFIAGARGDGYIEDDEGGVIDLRALLDTMNQRIRFLLNRDLMIGHAYLCKIKNFAALRDVILNQLVPLLQEYFYNDWHRIQLVFRDIGPTNEKLEPQIIEHSPVSETEILGFDHDDFDDLTEYRVAPAANITPDSIRKIYESQV